MLKTIDIKITYESNDELSFRDGFDDCVSEFLDSIDHGSPEFSTLINKREANDDEIKNYKDGI